MIYSEKKLEIIWAALIPFVLHARLTQMDGNAKIQQHACLQARLQRKQGQNLLLNQDCNLLLEPEQFCLGRIASAERQYLTF